ncbi:hypothetical protein C2S53_007505 [Perilla frutescens var. hirtella]|uniref:Uncharacterized protein n=1 Tax=Perilla frutescens var. hirtella TaxID=608512 RepID=A0AAD4JAS4_PERFH|nr:hypothetical protein C2S53_007505 [Perilla frutescens var. hirtella]
MGSEQEKGTTEHVREAPEDIKIVEEAKASSSSSSHASLELDVDGDRNSDVNDSNAKSKSDGDSKIVEEARTGHLQLPSASHLTSSSSSRASLELDIDRNSHLNDSIVKSKSDGDLSRGQESTCTHETPQWTMSTSTSMSMSAVGLEGGESISQITSPPVQIMESSSGYDPDRIPASVFSSKTTNEWSMASNDSLFSIHMGNSSIACRDEVRSGELPRLDSLYVLEGKSHELCSLPPLMEVPANEECSVKSSNVSILEKDDDPNDSPKATPRLSNESGHSSTSFAFPVLVSEGGKGSRSLEQEVEEKPELQTQDSAADKKSRGCSWLCCLPRCC